MELHAPTRRLLTFIEIFALLSIHWLAYIFGSRKWFEPRSYILGWNLIARVKWVLGRTVGDDWRSNILSGSHVNFQPSLDSENGFPLRMLKCQSPSTVLLMTPFTRTIKFHPRIYIWEWNYFLILMKLATMRNRCMGIEHAHAHFLTSTTLSLK